VFSDWASVVEMVTHGFAEDDADAARKGIQAGVDVELVTTSYAEHAEKLLASGAITMEIIDDCVLRVLNLKNRFGLFEKPYFCEDELEPEIFAESRAVAKKLAEESCVLLKNEKTLPFSDIGKIAVVGPLADSPQDQVGCWSMDAEFATVVTPLAALRERYGDGVNYVRGLRTSRDTDKAQFAGAEAAAEAADVTVMFLGEEEILSGESKCRAYLNLPGAQPELLEAVAEKAKKLVVVVMAGRPLVMGRVAELADAVLYAWHPGNLGGGAIADLLSGRAVPSGKLPAGFPRCEGQIPVYMGKRNTGRPAPEGARVGIPQGTALNPDGYTSAYLDCDATPLYPFGYGLSYTTFEYADLKLSSVKIGADEILAVSFDLKNTGAFDAAEVVQLYTRDHAGSVTRPVRELKDFKRVFLKTGETRRVEFALAAEQLKFYNIDNKFVLEPGKFTVFAGGASDACLSAEFEIVV